jgi:colicin import membrane protein
MAQRLTEMEITEISLVDEPANPEAKVLIVKSKGGAGSVSLSEVAKAVMAAIEDFAPQIVEKAVSEGFSDDPQAAAAAAAIIEETVMDMEAVTKALEKAEADLAALTKRAEAAESKIKEQDDIIKAKDDEIAKAKGAADPKADEEEILKALPESIRKRLEDADKERAEFAKKAEEAELKEAVAKAKSFGVGDAEKVGGLLIRIGKGKTTADDLAEIEAILRAAAAVSSHSALFKSIGAAEAVDGDPEEMLKAKATEIQKANDGMTFAAAYDKALGENPQLYNAYIAKRRAPAA